jgi:hypothetical protein
MGVVARRMAGVPGRVPELRRFAAEPEDAANCLFEGGNPPFRRRRTHMHQTSLRAVRLVGVSAAILIISCGLALARPGGHGGGSHGGGHHGGHGAGLSHGGAMHQRGHSGHHATANKSHNKHLADKHRGNDGTPAGFRPRQRELEAERRDAAGMESRQQDRMGLHAGTCTLHAAGSCEEAGQRRPYSEGFTVADDADFLQASADPNTLATEACVSQRGLKSRAPSETIISGVLNRPAIRCSARSGGSVYAKASADSPLSAAE